MKILSFILALFISVNTGAQTLLKTDSVYLSGSVANFLKHKEKANSIEFVINNLALGSQVTHVAMISDDGSYYKAFLKTGAQDVMMIYNDHLVNILVAPGDHLQVDFNADHFETTRTYKGDDASANTEFDAFDKARDKYRQEMYGGDRYSRFHKLSDAQKNDQPDDYKKFLTERSKADKTWLDTYLQQNKLSPFFVQWANADLKYEYLNDMMRYVWLHPMQNKMKRGEFSVPENYYDFIKTSDLNDAAAAISSNFGEYLHEYIMYNRDKEMAAVSKIADQAVFYEERQPGFLKDVMLGNWIYQFTKSRETDAIKLYVDKAIASIKQPGYAREVKYEYDQAVDKLHNYTMPLRADIVKTPLTAADKIFNSIVAKYPGKVVYVDFWATWCGPCREEMPSSAKLQKKFDGKAVVFVYLCVQSEEKNWKSSIAEMNMQGQQFLLTNNDFKPMQEKFKISGIPHYVLVDKQGRIAYDTAKRPSDDKLPADIETLLAAK